MHHSQTRYLKIYGERNCGTHYLARLVAQNLAATLLPGVAPTRLRRFFRRWPSRREQVIDLYFTLTFRYNLGWKHMCAPSRAQLARSARPLEHTFFVFLVKNPYAWLLSLHRRPYHHPQPAAAFATFIRSPWPALGREHAPQPIFPHPVALWNQKVASYIRLLPSVRGMMLRYEDLVAAPEQALQDLAERGGFPWKSEHFRNVIPSAKGDTGKNFYDYQRYYREARWKDAFSEEDRAFLRHHLDMALLHKLGYDILE